MSYEYKVVPAPVRGLKAKGLKTPEDRFANALETAMNALGAEGWEYLRADTLPAEQREGFMSKTTVYQNMLVFRRAIAEIAVPGPEVTLEEVPVVSEEPPLTAERPQHRTDRVVTRPLMAERLTAEAKEDLRSADTPGKSDVAAE